MSFTPLKGSAFVAGDKWGYQTAEKARGNFNDHETRLLAVEAIVKKATVTLTDAQVKALPSTPVTIIAAPGSTTYISVLKIDIQTKFAAGAYTNINATYAAIAIAVDGSAAAGVLPSLGIADDSAQSPALVNLTTLLAATNTAMRVPQYMEANPAYVVPASSDGTYAMDGVAGCANKALTISADNNGSGNFTGGNAANSMRVNVYYTLESVL